MSHLTIISNTAMKLHLLLRPLLLISFIICYFNLSAQQNKITVKSPDQNVVATVFTANGSLQYAVQYRGQPVLEPSRMGLFIDSTAYAGSGKLVSSKSKLIQERFAWRGNHSTAQHYATAATIHTNRTSTVNQLVIEMQVFNNGVAFRYLMPYRRGATLNHELTTFAVPEQAQVWWQGDVQNYEGEYKQNKPAEIKTGQAIGLPLTMVLPHQQCYAAIVEADVNHYAGMHLEATGSNAFHASLDGKVKLTGNIKTPWRIITIGRDLDALVNNDIIASLSPKPDPALFPKGFNTDWIKPGKSVWSWMTDNRSVTPENMRRFSDLASQCGIPYNLVDDGWGRWQQPGKDKWQMMRDLVDYSAAKKVKIWVWAAYPDNNGIPGLKDSVYMMDFFRKCHETGIVGVKIDFMSSETQAMMDFYNRASREAAKLQLMIDFHGAGKPSGQSRTWPNELSREAVRGLEYSDGTDYPTHNTIIPFTRYLAGHGDYTPLSMDKFVSSTTLAHQVATVVTFTSPFLCLGVDPAKLLKSEALPFVQAIPSVWDETRVLPASAIGEVCVMARRSGTTWFLAVLNNKQTRTLSIPLSFLNKANYSCKVIGNITAANSKTVNSKDKFTVNLTSGDGLVAIFRPR
ncbi:glycoside hydrolase family 97 protein [Mucilaginibacter koreensis]